MSEDARVASAVAGLEKVGYAIVGNLTDGATMAAIGEELAPHFAAVPPEARGNATTRIHSRVLADAPILQQQLIDPVVHGVMARLLGPHCVRWQLSSVQGIAVHPGATEQGLHRDDDIFRLPHPHPVFEVNVMWAVTDFTAQNGATRVVPDSHLWPSGRTPEPDSAVPAEMEAGSALFWLGSTWHGAGANRSQNVRIGFYAGYSLGWLRQEETMVLALPPETVAPMPEVLQRLIGYELKGSMTLGWLDGRDPRKVLGMDT
jgi:ectoine hydroxylase-related dioxygenase (phytanoyl-CoA dioxygenase family)